MSQVIQDCEAGYSDKPPSYRVLEDAELAELVQKGRETRSSQSQEYYSLVSVKGATKSLGDTTDHTSRKLPSSTPTLPVAPSAPEPTDSSFDSDEFSVKFNACSLHNVSLSERSLHDVVSNEDVFDDVSTTVEVHNLGARSKVNTSWPEVVYTSVRPLSLPPPLAATAYVCAPTTAVSFPVTYTSVVFPTSTITSTSTSTTTSFFLVQYAQATLVRRNLVFRA